MYYGVISMENNEKSTFEKFMEDMGIEFSSDSDMRPSSLELALAAYFLENDGRLRELYEEALLIMPKCNSLSELIMFNQMLMTITLDFASFIANEKEDTNHDLYIKEIQNLLINKINEKVEELL